MIPVIIESPYASTDLAIVRRNKEYARRCMYWAFAQGEAPFLSHLLFTQVLDDQIPEERKLGIEAGLVIGKLMERTIVCEDYGVSGGMHLGIDRAKEEGRMVIYRAIGKNP